MNELTASSNSQRQAPLLDALAAHVQRQPSRWHTPGHKGAWVDRVWHNVIGSRGLAWDLTELHGLDNLHQPEGPIAEAENLTASLYGGDRAFFLVNGASAGLQAVLLSVSGSRPIMLPRHVHRALVGGLMLADLTPRWLQPDLIGPWALPVGPSPAAVRAAISHERPALAVFIHPTYHGYTADLGAAIAACHEAGVPVLVDAAHGAHLRFHEELPPDPLALGADAVVYSFHKTLGAATGAAVLVTQGNRLDRERIQAALTLVQTSSPSYLLLASLDAARREAARSATARLDALLPALRAAQTSLRQAGIGVEDGTGLPPGFGHDPTKLLFSLGDYGMSGAAVVAALHAQGVDLEMAEAVYALALVTPADTPVVVEELTRQLVALAAQQPTPMPPEGAPSGQSGATGTAAPGQELPSPGLPPVALRPAEAQRRPWQAVPLKQAAGRIAARLVSVSPPGIANVVPGELIDEQTVAVLRQALRDGLVVQGLHAGPDPSVMVVAQ